MRVTSLTSRLTSRMGGRGWPWWRLPSGVRWYVATPPVLAFSAIVILVTQTDWHVLDLVKFAALLACGLISVASTPRGAYANTGMTRDFGTVWVLPVAILLPPVYAALTPIPLLLVIQWWVHRGVIYRRVFTCASVSLGYAAASELFRAFPSSFGGDSVGSGLHALTWALAVGACEIVGGRVHHLLIVGAIKLTDPCARIVELDLNRESLQADLVEFDLAVLITLAVAISPILAIFAVPTFLLVRRFIVHSELVTQSRIDAKTGLLNVSTWEREAEAELSRAARTRSSLALALVDIDHFKLVNDTYGHLVGDKVLRSVAETLTGHLRDYDRAGRFGGEEFVLLLAHTNESDACRIAERLRTYVGDLAIPANENPNPPRVRLTISIGVTAMEDGHSRDLTDLLAAADSALYHAKQTGRNKVAVARPSRQVELEVVPNGHLGVVEVDPARASLGLSTSL